jgi:SAM-dependent methyltransferase
LQSITELPEDHHWWYATRTGLLLNLLDPIVARRDAEILDVGCGAGDVFHHLRRYGRIKGIEVDLRPAAVAKSRGYAVCQVDATRGIPFPSASFDLITALDALEHMDDDAAIVCEAHRLLRPHGIFAITTPAFQWLWSHNDVLNAHKRRYAARELRKRVEQGGFRIKRLTFGFFLVFPMSAPLILLRNRLGVKPQLSSYHFEEEAYQVEMEPVPPWLNAILRGAGRVESALVKWFDLPVGTSLLCIAEKV